MTWIRSLHVAGIALTCLILAAGSASGQQVTVDRSRLARRLPVPIGTTIATVGAAGADSMRVTGSITVDRTRFLAFRTAELGESVRGELSDSVLRAPTGEAPGDPQVGHPITPEDTAGATQGGDTYVVLPFRFMTADATGSGLWVLRPVFQVNQPLRHDDDSDLFRGSFYLTVEDSANRGTSRALDVPIRLRVTAEADSLAPVELTFDRTNFPLHEVAVAASRAVDSVRVRIIPEFDLRGVDVWMPVRPEIVIESPERSIQGLGIETATVTVSLRGQRMTDPVTVRFESDRGTFEPEQVTLGADGTGAVRIRSAGLGSARIRAFAPGFGDDEVTYRFGFPLPFVLAALLGGVAGGVGAAMAKQRVTRAGLRRALSRGLVYGLLAAVVYYAIGISLLGVDVGVARFNEAAVFAFAALAGLFGLRLPGIAGTERKSG